MNLPEEDLLSLIARLHTQLKRYFDREMNEHGASLARTKMLIVIQREEGMLRAADIADRFGIAPRTVTEMVDGLEREGLVERVPDLSDRRVKRLKMTKAGAAAVAVTEPLRQRIASEIVGVLGPEERRAVEGAVAKMLERIPSS